MTSRGRPVGRGPGPEEVCGPCSRDGPFQRPCDCYSFGTSFSSGHVGLFPGPPPSGLLLMPLRPGVGPASAPPVWTTVGGSDRHRHGGRGPPSGGQTSISTAGVDHRPGVGPASARRVWTAVRGQHGGCGPPRRLLQSHPRFRGSLAHGAAEDGGLLQAGRPRPWAAGSAFPSSHEPF